MEEFERKLRRAAVKRRKEYAPKNLATNTPADLEHKKDRAAVRLRKIRAKGIETGVCVICGSDDVSRFELDHVAGRKHHDQEWPLCETCHQERTSMQCEQPSPSDIPRNVFEVIGRWLLAIKEYLEMLLPHLGKYGEFLIELAKQGYGAELKLPK
jgi:hypothetical protein